MDGSLALVFLLTGLADMTLNHCPNGCLAPSPSQARFAVSAGDVQFQGDSIGQELYLRYEFDHSYGPFQPMAGVSLTDGGDGWIGMGAAWTGRFWNDRAYLQLHLMPGLYLRGDGPDLGSPLEFRSGAEIGYEARSGMRIGLSYDHRSNSDISSLNPGLETVQLRVSLPLR